MRGQSCLHCGRIVDDESAVCPVCGTPRQAAPDPTEQQILALLDTARRAQQQGDLPTALRTAREALSLRHDCSTIHALLGYLYEQQGNQAASRYHYQAALNVPACTGEAPALAPPPLPAHPRRTWVSALLIACILCSGVAALITFWNEPRPHDRASIMRTTMERPPLPSTPQWTWQVPKPAAHPQPPVTPPTPPAPRTPPVSPSPRPEPTPAPPPEAIPATYAEQPHVLGPAAHQNAGVMSVKATLDAADQAYQRGQFGRAVTLYEELLQQTEEPNPRLRQDLAWCYQQLGESQRATAQLETAVRGYQAILARDPDNAIAKEALARCERALQQLHASQEHPAP